MACPFFTPRQGRAGRAPTVSIPQPDSAISSCDGPSWRRARLRFAMRSRFSLLLDNPVLHRELRARFRGRGAFAVLLVYALMLVVPAVAVYGQARGGNSDNAARLGRALFESLSWLQTLGWMILAPALTATGLAHERETGLLEGLQLSPLSPARIVWGKLGGAMVFIGLLLMVPLPVMGLCFLIGGLSPQEFVASLGLQAMTAFCGASIGVFCSAWSRRAGIALRSSFALVLIGGLTTRVAFWLTGGSGPWFVRAIRLPSGWVSLVFSVLGRINPLTAVASLSGTPPSLGGIPDNFASRVLFRLLDYPAWQLSIAAQGAFAGLLLWSACRALRRPFAETFWFEPSRPIVALPTGKSKPEDAPPIWEMPISAVLRFENPVLQREARSKFRLKRVPLLAILIEGALALLVVFAYLRALWWALFEPLARPIVWWVLSFTVLLTLMCVAPLLGAASFTREREAGTWQGLHLSLLSAGEILRGKVVAPILACLIYSLPMWPLLLPCVRWSGSGVPFTTALSTIGVLGAMTACYLAWGLWLSWRCASTALAAGWTMGSLFLILILGPVLLGQVVSLPSGSAFWAWHPFVVIALLSVRAPHAPLFCLVCVGLHASLSALLLWRLHSTMRRAGQFAQR